MGNGYAMLPGGLEVVVESSTSCNPILIPNEPATPTTVHCLCANPQNTYVLNALSTSAPSVEPLLPVTPSTLASCGLAPFVESVVMWAPLAQPQLWLAVPLFLPEWVILEGFESVPQGYDGGNVTVEEHLMTFSPFPSIDCTMFNHFSLNNFVATAFPDLAGDLDIQI